MDKQQEEITDIQYITALLEKVFERTNKIQALESNFSDMIFYSLLISVFGIGLVLLANRFIPENFLKHSTLSFHNYIYSNANTSNNHKNCDDSC